MTFAALAVLWRLVAPTLCKPVRFDFAALPETPPDEFIRGLVMACAALLEALCGRSVQR